MVEQSTNQRQTWYHLLWQRVLTVGSIVLILAMIVGVVVVTFKEIAN